jgi:hypothetical protein
VTASLATIRYGELVAMILAPAIILLIALLVGAVLHRRSAANVPKA